MDLKAIVYDWDGVLNDSFHEGLRRIKVLAALNDVPFTVRERQRLMRLWGVPGRELLEKGLDIGAECAAAMYRAWEKMDACDPVSLIPGARDVLRWARLNGLVNALLTTRNQQNIDDIFGPLDLHREFGVISARQHSPYHKPDPRVFGYVLGELAHRFGIAPASCVFVGDTIADLAAGLDAGLETIIVQTGPYTLAQALERQMPIENVLVSVDNLPDWASWHFPNQAFSVYA